MKMTSAKDGCPEKVVVGYDRCCKTIKITKTHG